MIRFVFRALAFVFFAIAVMFAVIDVTRSIGVSAIVLTPFEESVVLVAPDALEALRVWLGENVPAIVTGDILATLLGFPTFAVCTALSFLLYALGRKPPQRGLRRAPR
jgi:acid phosphatase family membrane protein YuiD